MDQEEQYLYENILSLQNIEECFSFFRDLCTPQELNSLKERIKIANILLKTDLSYRQINKQTGVSLTTISRIARFLNQENYQGYKKILNRQNSLHPKL